MNLSNDLIKGRILLNEPLSNHTYFRIGGPVSVWSEPEDLDDLRKLIAFSKTEKTPIFPIGYGSNILVRDKGFRAVAIYLHSGGFNRINFKGETASAGGGTSLSELVSAAKAEELGGIEFLVGIPGTVGGAIVGNAGVRDITYSEESRAGNSKSKMCNIDELVEEVTVMDLGGKVKTLKKNKMKFGYRNSNLSDYIILNAELGLHKKDKKEISQTMDMFLDYKKKTQELSMPSAGCVFKNPPINCRNDNNRIPEDKQRSLTGELSAGKLIDLCGLKGKKIGDAEISIKHGNFIINRGNATAGDVLNLIELIRNEVKKKHGIWLDLEIKVIGEI